MSFSRRAFLAAAAAAAAGSRLQAKSKIPVGLELYSVRNELRQDLMGTVRAVAKMGYQGVEFFSPYYDWTTDYTKEVRKLLDELGLKCYSTHNGSKSFTPDGIGKAMELNQILGSKHIVMASAGRVEGLDGWKKVAELLTQASEKMRGAGMRAAFHNHQLEFRPIDGTRPMDVLAKNTPKEVGLQLDVGTCMEVGVDPVGWINQNPGRITSVHCKEWSPEPGVGYKAILGQGKTPWKQIFAAAEKKGGVEFYLVEQEGSDFPPMETAEKSLQAFRKIRG